MANSDASSGADTEAADGRGRETVIIGAGPAGLTAAYELSKKGQTATVLEADNVVGGISRTVERNGWRFDIGGHRFFTKVRVVDDLWFEILGSEEFLRRPRMSRIYYRNKLYDYPIRPMNALRNLGIVEAIRCMVSYLWVRVRPPKNQDTLEGYIAANYGWRLYQHFFKTYNEKVWGVPASKLSADWGAQRIKGMSLWAAVWEPIRARFAKRDRSRQVTSLIEEFNYPKYGPGQMWEKAADIVAAKGSKLYFNSPVVRIERSGARATAVYARTDGGETRFDAGHVISSMPFNTLVEIMDPPPPENVMAAARALRHRDFMTVALVVPEEFSFPDNWIYIHDPEVRVGRIQNFGSWSPYLVKDGRTCLGLEFFVNEGDDMWTKPDDALIAQATDELERLGLVTKGKVETGYVVRMPKAYPVYDPTYQENVEIIRNWLAENATNVHPVGRNGMHKYNNQDHSMLTALLSVENIVEHTSHDVWQVNVDDDYHEEGELGEGGGRGTGREAPILPSA